MYIAIFLCRIHLSICISNTSGLKNCKIIATWVGGTVIFNPIVFLFTIMFNAFDKIDNVLCWNII